MTFSTDALQTQFQSCIDQLEAAKQALHDDINAAGVAQLRQQVVFLAPLRVELIRFDRAEAYYDSDTFFIQMAYKSSPFSVDLNWWDLLMWAKYPHHPEWATGRPVNASAELAERVIDINTLCEWLLATTRGPKTPIEFETP